MTRREARAALAAFLYAWRGPADLLALIAALYRAGLTIHAVGAPDFWAALDAWRAGRDAPALSEAA